MVLQTGIEPVLPEGKGFLRPLCLPLHHWSKKMVARVRIELTYCGFSVRRLHRLSYLAMKKEMARVEGLEPPTC